MGDVVIFDGRQYTKEDFMCYPSKEPSKRMRYRNAFYELWKQKEAERLKKSIGEITSHRAIERFTSYFFKLYADGKKENKPITWDDFKHFEL